MVGPSDLSTCGMALDEDKDIEVYTSPLPMDLSGRCARVLGGKVRIDLAARLAQCEQFETFLHECGHAIHHVGAAETELRNVEDFSRFEDITIALPNDVVDALKANYTEREEKSEEIAQAWIRQVNQALGHNADCMDKLYWLCDAASTMQLDQISPIA